MADPLLRIGIAGSVIAGLCCFTPLLPAVLGTLGLAGLLDVLYNDAVLLPVLGVFLGLAGLALWRRRG